MTSLAVVVNPTKLADSSDARRHVNDGCQAAGWGEALWLETTADDVGFGQARKALEAGADVVVAWGGDGTVRAVADVLKGTDTPLAIVPAGTGNLLCRNLGIPLGDVDAALRIAVDGDERRIDVGQFTLDDGRTETFLVIAGVGFDAHVMDETNEAVKKRIGWIAYVGGVARAMFRRGFRVLRPDGKIVRAGSVMVCNCGILGGGLTIAPDASPDDGLLDLVILAPKGGWLRVFIDVVSRLRRGTRRVQRTRGESVTYKFDRPVLAQVDGDTLVETPSIRARVARSSLTVRVPR